MDEFDLIAEIRRRAGAGSAAVVGIGDDAAVVELESGRRLVATTDNLVAGRHFIEHGDAAASARELGHLALAVNLSDLAAMGARPRWSLAALTLPHGDPDWLGGFLDGYLALSERHGCALVGGNLARGPLNIAVTALGDVENHGFVTRTGARPGDRIVVTGTLGDAAAALALGAAPGDPLRARLLTPEPRTGAGAELADRARAMIDVSDGLLADLSHLLDGCGAEIGVERLPASDSLLDRVRDVRRRQAFQLTGGSDYELLAVLPGERPAPAEIAGVQLTEIGRIVEAAGIRCMDADGRPIEVDPAGWDHFRADHP